MGMAADLPVGVALSVISFCQWEEQLKLQKLNKHWAISVFGTNVAWKLVCDSLQMSTFVYCPPENIRNSWKECLKVMLTFKNRWLHKEEKSSICTSTAEYAERIRNGEEDLEFVPKWKVWNNAWMYLVFFV